MSLWGSQAQSLMGEADTMNQHGTETPAGVLGWINSKWDQEKPGSLKGENEGKNQGNEKGQGWDHQV